jgi:hypothetical protein
MGGIPAGCVLNLHSQIPFFGQPFILYKLKVKISSGGFIEAPAHDCG